MDAFDNLKSFIFGRRHAYNVVFRGTEGEKVLDDLATFCRATETTFHTDPYIAALQEGRREVFLRIQQHLNLSPEELFSLVTGQARRTAVPDNNEREEID